MESLFQGIMPILPVYLGEQYPDITISKDSTSTRLLISNIVGRVTTRTIGVLVQGEDAASCTHSA